jgi:hypothetical protein
MLTFYNLYIHVVKQYYFLSYILQGDKCYVCFGNIKYVMVLEKKILDENEMFHDAIN